MVRRPTDSSVVRQNLRRSRPRRLFICSFSALSFLLVAAAVQESDGDGSLHDTDKNLVLALDIKEWVLSRGGRWHYSLEIRREIPGNTTSLLGVFASKDIEEGEKLVSVPWELIIRPPNGYFSPSTFRPDEWGALTCATARRLADEMRQGHVSDFAPYVTYLLRQTRGQIPSDWSEAGKALLGKILGPRGLPPGESTFAWIDQWRDVCGGAPDDDLGEKAALLCVQRSEDDLMVPLYDLFNHRNGRWHNTRQGGVELVNFDLVARRVIREGEQVYNSYSRCERCIANGEGYGTPDILRDFGFVERMPQRWTFYTKEGDVMFDLNYEGEDEGTDLQLSWVGENRPTPLVLAVFRDELHRLLTLGRGRDKLRRGLAVSDKEWDVAWQYHAALQTAIRLAVKSMTHRGNNRVVSTKKFRDEL